MFAGMAGAAFGMSFFARRSNAIVVPTLIKGANSWEIGQRVDLVFGQPIDSKDKNRTQIDNEWRVRMAELQTQIPNS